MLVGGFAAGYYIGDQTGLHDWLADKLAEGFVICMARNERGQRNYLNDEAARLAQGSGKTPCQILAAMMAAAKASGDTKLQIEIKKAQKAGRCRHSNK